MKRLFEGYSEYKNPAGHQVIEFCAPVGPYLLAALIVPFAAQAQVPYPNQSIRFIVPFAPGGLPDTVARITAPTVKDAANLQRIMSELRARGCHVPIVADIHFHYKRAIEAADAGAACLRINPGNIGSAERVREVVKAAAYGIMNNRQIQVFEDTMECDFAIALADKSVRFRVNVFRQRGEASMAEEAKRTGGHGH